MGDKVVQLSSKKHHENMLSSLHQMRLRGQLSDMVVQVDYYGELEEFQVHQVMLAASSGYFSKILLNQDAAPEKLFLSNMRTTDFAKFLDFVYTGKVEVVRDEIGDVRKMALLLDCRDLSEICGEAMEDEGSREPTEMTNPSSQVKADSDGTETTKRVQGSSPLQSILLKRHLPSKSADNVGIHFKRLKAKDTATVKAVNLEGNVGRRLSNRLAGRKVAVGISFRKTNESCIEVLENNNQNTAVKTEENKDEADPNTQQEGQDEKKDLSVDVSGGVQRKGGILEDDPLYLSLEEGWEEGESQTTSKRSSKAQFLCEKCLRTFRYERSYLKHISTYHGVKAKVTYRCETCQQTFANRGNLKIHEKHVHNDERLFTCQFCIKTFKRKKDVIRHQRQVHEGGGRRHVCPDCGKMLSSKTALILHERTHTGAKPFECTECEAKFTQSSALKMHQRIHTGEKPFACDECDARFTQKHMLSYHKRSHTGEKPFMCEACGKSFASKEYLRHHSNIHTGSKPYKCDECGRGFAQRNSLHQHLKIHTGERPYSCKDCDKQFTQLNALQRHQRIHTGEKPYMCGLCNRTFTDKSTVRRHTMTHDTDAPWKNYLVVLKDNVEEKKPKPSPKGKAEKSGSVERQDKGENDGTISKINSKVQPKTLAVQAESVALPADWASHGTIALVSHSALGGITVIHTEVPTGTQIQPIVTTDSTGASVISIDGSAISVPFSLPVSMAHPISVHSTAATSSPLTVPVSVSEATLTSVSKIPIVSTASVLEAAVSQTILAPASGTNAAPDMMEPESQTGVGSEKGFIEEQTATLSADAQGRTAEGIGTDEAAGELAEDSRK